MIQPVMMRARGLYGPFYQRYNGGWVHSVGNKFSASLLQQILAIPGIVGYWSPQPGYVFEDAAGTIPASVDGVVGCCNSVSTPAIQATTAVKPYWRKTPTSNVYWLDSNTTTSSLTATLGNLGAACTVAQAGAAGVTFTEGVTITTTYNIATAFGFNTDIAIFNRALTATEKDLLTRYMQHSVPVLGANIVTNGTFDTGTTGWTADANATIAAVGGWLRVENAGSSNRNAYQITLSTTIVYYATSVGRGDGSAAPRLLLGNNAFSAGIVTAGVSTPLSLTAYPSTTRIQCRCQSATITGVYAEFDNVTCQEIL